jgi:hypothetical protein
VLVIDDSGDRKDGVKTAHAGHQYLGRYGKTDNGVVTVTTVWADEATWYLVTNLPRPGSPREAASPHPAAGLAEITRIYGIRNWIEQGCKQVKDELGWADFQVRSDTAIRRHQALVNCAFSFCWDAWFADTPPQQDPAPPRPEPGRGERGAARRLTPPAPSGSPLDRAATLVVGMVESAPPPQLQALMTSVRPRPAPLHPELTTYR